MPVQTIKINRPRSDGQEWENIKPLYLCDCGDMASYGFTITNNNKRRRIWKCKAHREIGESMMTKA